MRPVAGSTSMSWALTIAPVKSLATSCPILPDLITFWRTRASPSGVGWKSGGMTLPPEKPSSTTSVYRTFGVKRDCTWARSTPCNEKTSSVVSLSNAKNSGVKMSPLWAISATITRLAPPNSLWYFVKVRMYGCSSGRPLL